MARKHVKFCSSKYPVLEVTENNHESLSSTACLASYTACSANHEEHSVKTLCLVDNFVRNEPNEAACIPMGQRCTSGVGQEVLDTLWQGTSHIHCDATLPVQQRHSHMDSATVLSILGVISWNMMPSVTRSISMCCLRNGLSIAEHAEQRSWYDKVRDEER
eukprot:437595-Amphidinium_carterae.2